MPRVNFTADFAIIRRTGNPRRASHDKIVHQKGVERAWRFDQTYLQRTRVKNFLSISVFESNEQWDYLMVDIDSLKVTSKSNKSSSDIICSLCLVLLQHAPYTVPRTKSPQFQFQS